jgi:serine/threonine protein phosphatase PrpC
MRIVNRTTDQQHSFNCPYQLARLPEPKDFPALLAEGKGALVRAVRNCPASRQDKPSDAQIYTLTVQEGDLIILGTDGVFDNLHDREVCQLAECAVSPLEARQAFDLSGGKLLGQGCTDVSRVAEGIAKAASHRSRDASARTPFSLHAKEAGLYHVGGKMDDITVVAAWVVRTSEILSERRD